jgi:hypothetical protein
MKDMKITERRGKTFYYEFGEWGLEVCPSLKKENLWDTVIIHNGLACLSCGFWQGLDEIEVKNKLSLIQQLEEN